MLSKLNVHRLHAFTVSCVLLVAAATPSIAAVTDHVKVERVAVGLARPVYVTAPVNDPDRLFILEQHTGRIAILHLSTGTVDPTAFLTVPGLASGNEQGLLGLAFHPDYDANGFFYVNYTAAGGTTHVTRYQRSAGDPDRADAGSATTVLTITQPDTNHNGGWMGFGPDGYLYIASGDGGGGNDTGVGHTPGIGNAQDITDNLLGKMLRIDVNGDDFPLDPNRNYAIPPGNPFVGVTGDDEIWSYGLRNPWRASFDRDTGDLYIGDVGQGAREEIDFQPGASGGGENYGWRLREGKIATPGSVGGPPPPGAAEPVYDYSHGSGPFQGRSVTGGYVYRGPILALRGEYFFADYVSEQIWSIRHDGTTTTGISDWTSALVPDVGSIDSIASFGEDATGNLYVVDIGGEIFRLAPVCRLDLALSSDASGVTANFQLGTDVGVLWSNWLFADGNLSLLFPLLLPPFAETSLTLPLPAAPGMGLVALLSLFSTVDGIICAGFDFVDTGSGP